MASRRKELAQVLAIALLSCTAACSKAQDSAPLAKLGRFDLGAGPTQQWKLPKKLKEISGLALTPDDRLFTVTDERAIIYEVDYQQGEIIKSFALGNPTARADFEGIAYLNDLFYLVTSNGLVYVAAEGNDGERVAFEIYQTGLGRYCEIEGLAQDVRTDALYLSCKQSWGQRGKFSLFVWSAVTHRVLPEREAAIPENDIAARIGKKRVRPSAIVVDPETANIYGVAGPQRAIFELKPNGDLIDAIILPLANRHRQPEGIEITRDGKLLIADEGGKKKARLSVYAPGHKKTTDQQE